MSLEPKDGERVAVALFPVDYETVEMVTDQGKEILQQDFSEAQLFLHSIQELERVRMERNKTKKRKITAAMSTNTSTGSHSVDKHEESKKSKLSDPVNNSSADSDEPVDDVDNDENDIEMKQEVASEEEQEQEKAAGGAKKARAENGVATMNGHGDDDQTEPTTTSSDVMVTATADAGADEKHNDEQEQEQDEEEVIDPRIHYRPMVAELQASIIELNQLINTIDLVRRREYLEDLQCIRENTTDKKDDLEYLVESKAHQLKESSKILLAGVDALTLTVEKESNFFDGVDEMIRKWKICAPIHGNIPKPFRGGEPLAVDCSFVSAGSRFVPPTRSIADLSFAELSRTEKGLVCIKAPEEYMARTIQVELKAVASGSAGSYRLPPLKMSTMTRAALDRLENTPEDLKILDDRNSSVLKAVQFSVFCEELFYTVMQEALWTSGNWSDAALSATNTKKPVAKKAQRSSTDDTGGSGPGNVSVVEILDDEIRLRLRDQYEMTIRLLDARTVNAVAASVSATTRGQPNPHEPHSDDQFLSETCRFALLLLQQEIRQRHGRNDISRGMLFTSADGTSPAGVLLGVQQHPQPDGDKFDGTSGGGVLAAVVTTVSHNLLKNEVATYLDDLSAKLAWQQMQSSATGRILEDGLNQPICDSVRGIYVSPRWKTCPYDSTLTALDLHIGKNFSTEILISGTKIRFEDGPGTLREISNLSGLKRFVEQTICSQVAQSLDRDFASFGLKQSSVDLDRASVRLFIAGEWDGSCIGDGRVPDTKPTSCIVFEPYVTPQQTIAIKCVLQAVETARLGELGTTRTNGKGEARYEVEWVRIPGTSDVAKVVWLLQKTAGLPAYFAHSAKERRNV